MRKIITLLFLAAFCICSQAYSQNRADELMKQAQESLAKKEYIKARYLFLQAYNAFSSQAKYDKAVECGVNASALYPVNHVDVPVAWDGNRLGEMVIAV